MLVYLFPPTFEGKMFQFKVREKDYLFGLQVDGSKSNKVISVVVVNHSCDEYFSWRLVIG